MIMTKPKKKHKLPIIFVFFVKNSNVFFKPISETIPIKNDIYKFILISSD